MKIIDFVNVAVETVDIVIKDVAGRNLYCGNVLYTPFAYLNANVQIIDQGETLIILYTDIEPATGEGQ